MKKTLAALLALHLGAAVAELDRFGNVMRDDDGGSDRSAGMGLLFVGALVLVTYVGYKILRPRTKMSNEALGNAIWIAALIGAAVLLAAFRR